MLKLQWIEILLRLIPEMLLIVWGIYVVARKSINIKIYIILSVIIAIVTFFIRMLPIYFGVHTFIMVILIVCLMVIVGIPISKAVYGILLMILIISLSEFLNMAILNLLKINIDVEFTNPIMKSVVGIPTLVIAYLFIIIIRHFLNKKEGVKNVTN